MYTRRLERHQMQMHVRKATIYQAPNPDPAHPRTTST